MTLASCGHAGDETGNVRIVRRKIFPLIKVFIVSEIIFLPIFTMIYI